MFGSNMAFFGQLVHSKASKRWPAVQSFPILQFWNDAERSFVSASVRMLHRRIAYDLPLFAESLLRSP
jgi:hypothetical protein